MQKNGFTLVETMVSMFISMLVIFGVVSAYINGISLMRKSGRQIRAQHQAITTMNKVGDYIRASIEVEVYDYIAPSSWTPTDQGNFLVAYGSEGDTTAFYFIANKFYVTTPFSQDIFNTNTVNKLSSNIKSDTYFLKQLGSLFFKFGITDNDDTNRVYFSSTTRFTLRN